MKYAVVTTFNQLGYDNYAQRMIKTFLKYWPSDVQLIVYAENCKVQESVKPIVAYLGLHIAHTITPALATTTSDPNTQCHHPRLHSHMFTPSIHPAASHHASSLTLQLTRLVPHVIPPAAYRTCVGEMSRPDASAPILTNSPSGLIWPSHSVWKRAPAGHTGWRCGDSVRTRAEPI